MALSGDRIYKEDYRDLLRFHQEKGADLTVAVMHVRPDEVHRFGIMSVDADQQISTHDSSTNGLINYFKSIRR